MHCPVNLLTSLTMKNNVSLTIEQIIALKWAARKEINLCLQKACEAQDNGDDGSSTYWARVATDLEKAFDELEKIVA